MNKEKISTELLSSNFIYDSELNIWVEKDQQEFNYNDGDYHENYILEVVTKAQDCSVLSQELAGYIKDWPSQYHLTSKRSNLLRPFTGNFKGKRILEIGCGCGAITRFIAETGADIVAVEGSKRRASITRNRCKNLENVTVINSSSEKIPDIGEFDYVLLIGVLEYAQCFLGSDGQSSLLSFCKKRLKGDGSLFVAIENQLGMKYLSGAKEDHLGIPMVGINNAYHANGVRTFGRVELIQMMKNVGFNNVEEFLPFPDYKLPTLLITPYGHQKRSSVIYPLVSEVHHKDAQAPDAYTFSLEESTKLIWNNNLSADLSNSFLMIASASSKCHETANTLAWYYSDARINGSHKKIKFLESNGDFKIESYKISGEFIAEEPFYQGESLWLSLIGIINKHGWLLSSVTEWAKLWISNALVTDDDTHVWEWNKELPPEYLDATPFNIIRTKEGYKIFDLELSSDKPLLLSYLVFRGIFNSLLRVTSVAPTKELADSNVFTTTKNIVKKIFPELTEDHFDEFLEQEVSLVSKVVNVDKNDLFERYKNSYFVVRDFLNDYKSELARIYNINNELASTLSEAEEHIKEKGEEIFGKNSLLDVKEKELLDTQEACSRLQEQIDNLLNVAAQQKVREQMLTEEIKLKKEQIEKVTSSKAWKLASFFSRYAKSLTK
ncbi:MULTISPECIES: bifunctional 2-polyprenyl-6-hydroxyphenol methylase/3-demethylubiquinol 3-O-methyltransferase UbiG [unclassified Pantoea]|uniref:class I SAM-dependent methyltransferase n=1 Tax=unclassified Pantoea TaxID=2630326 RepID=UPI0016819FC9|nr:MULTISPECIES: class I SAM-dependent methyltransferase [unclassified Pantoea]